MSRYAYCITGFARPVKVKECIDSINKFDKSAPILLFVDRADASNDPEIVTANRELILNCEKWKKMHLIQDFRIAHTNLITKRTCYAALQWGMEYFEYVVLIEDDLRLISNPSFFLEAAIDQMNKNSSIGMACLYASRNHRFPGKSKFRATKWPEMWGNLISKTQFTEISRKIPELEQAHIRNILNTFSKFSLTWSLSKLFQDRFQNTWEFKYTKAIRSAFAWDTEWQLGLWALDKYALTPWVSLVEDTGVDFSSVSPSKGVARSLDCKFEYFLRRQNLVVCKTCETRREHQNFTLPSIFFDLPILAKMIREGLL